MIHVRRSAMPLIGVLLLAILLGLAAPALAQSSVIVAPLADLNLRAAPNTTSAVLGEVPRGTELPALALSADRNWVAVDYSGQGGWLSLRYVHVVRGRLRQLGVSDQTFTANQSALVSSSVTVAPTIFLRYRATPDLSDRVLGSIPYQTQVPALGLSADGLFVAVFYNGQTVWVYRQYVTEVSGSLSQFTPGAPLLAGGSASPPSAPVEAAAPPAETTPAEVAPAGQTVSVPAGARSGVFIAPEGSSDPHTWQAQVPADLQAASADTARLIAYVTETQYVAQRCWFEREVAPGQIEDAGLLERMGVRYDVRLVNAQTGLTLGTRTYSREADECPWETGFPFSGDHGVYLPGVPFIDDALGWFRENLG